MIEDPEKLFTGLVPRASSEAVGRDVASELRRACAEMLLAGSLLLADVQRALGQWDTSHAAKQTEERFRKALEAGREALS